MTNEETINLLKTLSQTVDKLASFDRKKGDEKGDTIVNEDDKLSSTLSTTEKRRWETMSKILAKSIKDIVFPKGEEKVGRPEFKQKEIKDLVLSPTLAKLEDKSNKWITALLGALALLAGIVSGAIAEIVKMLKGLKLFLSETKLGKFIKEIFSAIKLKILELLKPIRETKFVKFIEDALKEKVIKPIAKLFETIGRVFKIVEGGKGPLLMMKAFPTFFKLFEDSIRIAFKVFQVGSKIGRLVGKILGPVLALFEVIVGLVEAFNDPKLKDKSFLQKVVTGLTKGLLNFFDFFEIFGLDLFKFETIRDRIEEIFKPFREGKWLQGLSQIGNQLSSVIISIPGKIVGWIIGWFDKDLGKKISDFFDRFDLGKFYTAIAKRIGNIFEPIMNLFNYIGENLGKVLTAISKTIFEPIMNLFNYIGEKISPYITTILTLLGGPVMWAFELLKKTFEYIAPLMKDIASLASKFFGYIKNFFVMIWDGIKSLADKISQIPFMKKVGEELKAIASESQITEMPTPMTATAPINLLDTTMQKNMANENFQDIFSMKENNTNEAFSIFGDQMGNLNKTNSVNNKIAVDQLREFKTLNQKFDMLMEQLANGKNVVNNVINQSTQNSFPQSTSVFDLRQGYRGN